MAEAMAREDTECGPRRGYFEHDADVGVFGRGDSIEAAFVAAAESVFDLITDISQVRPQERIDVDFEEPDADLALVIWLNSLLGQASERRLALGRFELQRRGTRWVGAAWGEPWREELARGVDVKGATLTQLAVRSREDGWDARCVVDV